MKRMDFNKSIWALVILVLASTVYADDSAVRLVTSRLNAAELQKVKYQIEIRKPTPPITASQHQQQSESEMLTLRSSNGVMYRCSVPSFADDDETAADGDSSVLSSMMKQYNFTDIHAKVNRTMNFFKTEGLCIYKNLGWWTYEFCYGSLVSQFHIQANGSILGEKISLGSFQAESNWSDSNNINSSPSSEAFYHEQHFDQGSLCELNQKPRRTVARIYCSENMANNIDEILEIESCVYEMKIYSSLLCDINGFKKAVANFDVSCGPVLDQSRYDKYLQHEKDRQERKRLEMAKKAHDHLMFAKQYRVRDGQEKAEYGQRMYEQERFVRQYEDEDLRAIREKTRAIFAEQEKTLVYDDDDEDDDVQDEEAQAGDDSRRAQVQDAKPQDDKLKSVLESEVVIDKLTETLTDLLDGLDTEDVETTTISLITDDKIYELEPEAAQDADNSAAAKPTESEADDSENEHAEIERLLLERLAKSNKLIADHLKDNKVKVKILTFDSQKDEAQQLVDDEDADGLSSVISRLIETEKFLGKQIESKSNYETDYNNLNTININQDDDDDDTNQNDQLSSAKQGYSNSDQEDNLIVF